MHLTNEYFELSQSGAAKIESRTVFCVYSMPERPVPVAARTKAWVCDRSPAEIAGSNPAGDMDVCCECCVLSSRGLCDGLIIRPEASYRLWCV